MVSTSRLLQILQVHIITSKSDVQRMDTEILKLEFDDKKEESGSDSFE
jgi:hypothetical protein